MNALFPRNEHTLDRAVRVVAGLVMLAAVPFVTSGVGATAGIALGLVAIVPLATGVLGSCPLYTLFGVSTCPLPAD